MGVAQEGNDLADDLALQGGLADEGVAENQDDRQQQDGEGDAGAGQLFGGEQGLKVGVFQLLAGLQLGVDGISTFSWASVYWLRSISEGIIRSGYLLPKYRNR